MNTLENIKESAFQDELQKIARNQVASGAIKGGTIGAGVGGATGALGSHAIIQALVKNLPSVAKNKGKFSTPVKILATLAGAIAGAELGGRAGAFLGGGVKGTYGLDSSHGVRRI